MLLARRGTLDTATTSSRRSGTTRTTLVRPSARRSSQVLRERANARRAQQAAEPEQRVGSWEQVVWLDENVQAALFDRAGRGGVIVEGTRDLDVVRELLRGG